MRSSGRFLPRKDKPPTPSPPPKNAQDQHRSNKLSQVAAFRALLEISPGTMQRVASSPTFLANTQSGKDISGSESRVASESKAGSQDDWMQDRDLLTFLSELEDGDNGMNASSVSVNEIVEDIMNDLIQKLSDAKSKKIGSAISNLSTSLSQHDIFKRVMTDDIAFRLESALDALLSALNRSRGSRSVSTVKDGLASLRLFIFLTVCLRSSRIEDSVSGSMLESLGNVLWQIVAPPKKSLASDPHLTWLAWVLIGLMLRNGLLHESLSKDGGGTEVWSDVMSEQASQIIERKRRQREEASTVNWSVAEILELDGICVCIALQLSHFGNAAFRDRESAGSVEFVWKLLRGLAEVCSNLEFVNAYASALGSDIIRMRGANSLLGLPHLIGISYQAFWSFFNERDRRESSPLDERDHRLLNLFAGFEGRLENASVKAITRSLTKEMISIFREASATLRDDAQPRPFVLKIQKNDVFDTLASHASQFESEEALALVGASIVAETWDELLILRCCKAAGGNHSTLAAAIEGEQTGMLREKADDTEGKSDRVFRQQFSRRTAQQSRKNDRTRKERMIWQHDG